MFSKKNKPKFISKTIALILLLALISFSAPKYAEAALWPGVDPEISQALQEIYDNIQGTILALQKTRAIIQMVKQVTTTLGGNSSSGPAFINNWQQFIIDDPNKQAKSFINDYISQATGGRGSLTSYEGFGGNGNYSAQLAQMAKSSTSEKKAPQVTYTGDPSQMFDSLNFKDMQTYLSGINNPWSFDAETQAQYQQKMADLQKIASTMATAYSGFKGVTSKGSNGQTNVTNPGSLVMMAAANAQDIGNKVLASATHVEEIIATVVAAINLDSLNSAMGNADNYVSQQNSTQDNYNQQVQNTDPQQAFTNINPTPEETPQDTTENTSPY